MTRVRGALLALVVALVALAGWGTWAIHHAQQVRDGGPGSQTPAHLAVAHALVDRLTVPAGAVRDPYASACTVRTTYCITSTRLSDRQLFASVTAQITTSGARQYDTHCVEGNLSIDCVSRFDLAGAHIAVMTGPGAYLSATVTDEAVALAGQRPSEALGTWAGADPFPARWVATATCTDTRPDGCHTYQSDRTHKSTISGTTNARLAQATQALKRQGFVMHHSLCRPALSQRPAACTISGFRSRSLGGLDGELLSLLLQQVDGTHVALLSTLSTT